jgi:hypothetical protein
MCVDDLLRPFFADEPSDCVCPVCSEHPLMAVSNYQKPPFIWRCEDADHYWREREQPAPIDGRLRCKCGADLRLATGETSRTGSARRSAIVSAFIATTSGYRRCAH